jgi:hypothetical protein
VFASARVMSPVPISIRFPLVTQPTLICRERGCDKALWIFAGWRENRASSRTDATRRHGR